MSNQKRTPNIGPLAIVVDGHVVPVSLDQRFVHGPDGLRIWLTREGGRIVVDIPDYKGQKIVLQDDPHARMEMRNRGRCYVTK